MSRVLCNHRKRQFRQICVLLLQEPSTLWHQLGDLKSKHDFSSYIIRWTICSSVQATRKPQKKGNPCFCSVWWGVTTEELIYPKFSWKGLCSSFKKSWETLLYIINLMVNINNYSFYHTCPVGRWWTVTVVLRCRKSLWALPSFANGLNGFRPLVNLFSNVLTFPQPPPSSVLLTMPGSSRDLHLPLCFLNRCFPLWFFLFFKAHNWSNLHPNK